MIFVHKESNGSEQNLERFVVVKIDNYFILKTEQELLESDITNIDFFEYSSWISEGNTPEIYDNR